MSDYGAVGDTYGPHKYCGAGPGANDTCVAIAMKAGVDQDGGGTDYAQVQRLMDKGLLTDADVRTAASRLFQARLELGLLNLPEASPYTGMAAEEWLDTDFHRQLSYEAAQQGMVLLKNDPFAPYSGNQPVLPLDGARIEGQTVAVIGPNADSPDVLYGNYQGTPPYLITPRMGLANWLGAGSPVAYQPGCADVACANTSGFPAALALATQANTGVIVGVFGIDQSVEAEGKDRTSLDLPGNQMALIQQLAAVAANRSIPFVLCLINGGPLNIAWPLASPNVPSILLVGYASQSTGDAVADILFGTYAPAGKLAVSWWANATTDLPDFADMAMTPNASTGSPGRTYRYSIAKPLLPFGHGFTYTRWSYSGLTLPTSPVPPCANVSVSVTLNNVGGVSSSEVVQVYLSWDASSRQPGATYPAPQVALAEFDRVYVPAGGSAQVTFTLQPGSLARVNASAAASFGQNFALSQAQHADVMSGRAFGLTKDYHSASLAAGGRPIGWDDMWGLVAGQVTVWVGSGQPGNAAGVTGTFTLGGSGVTNLAECDI